MCNWIVLSFVLFDAQSSFSICNPSDFNEGNKFNQGTFVSGVWMLNFKSK